METKIVWVKDSIDADSLYYKENAIVSGYSFLGAYLGVTLYTEDGKQKRFDSVKEAKAYFAENYSGTKEKAI